MSYKTMEFWLFFLPLLLLLSAWFATFDSLGIAKYLILTITVGWMILAFACMARELVRKVRG